MKRFLYAVIVLAAVVSCRKPDSTCDFVPNDKAKDGMYSFVLDMSDSIASYDIYIYSRIETPSREHVIEIPMDIWWVDPDQTKYIEKVYFCSGSSLGEKILYRQDVIPSKRGKWYLGIHPDVLPKNLCGFGVELKRKDYGAR